MSVEILHCGRMPWPVDWPALFGREAPLHLEIGFGGGQFLLDLARQRPSINLVGLEISLPSLRKVADKLARAGLPHVRIIQGGAETFLWALCPPQSLSGVYVNFPDPWPKAAHHHRRLINGRFMHLLATRLQPGATLYIATDHDDYALAIAEALAQTPYFASRLPTPFATTDDQRARTKYELKALAEGRTCRYFDWQRNEVAAPNPFPIPQELEMPHVVMRSPLPLGEMAMQFAPRYVPTDAAEVKLIALYQDPAGRSLLVDVYVNESPMSQRVGLTIRQRENGRYVIGLHEIGFPRPTPGIHHAVTALADWVASLHPETVVESSTVLMVK